MKILREQQKFDQRKCEREREIHTTEKEIEVIKISENSF